MAKIIRVFEPNYYIWEMRSKLLDKHVLFDWIFQYTFISAVYFDRRFWQLDIRSILFFKNLNTLYWIVYVKYCMYFKTENFPNIHYRYPTQPFKKNVSLKNNNIIFFRDILNTQSIKMIKYLEEGYFFFVRLKIFHG